MAHRPPFQGRPRTDGSRSGPKKPSKKDGVLLGDLLFRPKLASSKAGQTRTGKPKPFGITILGGWGKPFRLTRESCFGVTWGFGAERKCVHFLRQHCIVSLDCIVAMVRAKWLNWVNLVFWFTAENAVKSKQQQSMPTQGLQLSLRPSSVVNVSDHRALQATRSLSPADDASPDYPFSFAGSEISAWYPRSRPGPSLG